jgi:hypothetical protein
LTGSVGRKSDMKKILALGLVTLAALLLVGCSAINAGRITSREYTAPYTSVSFMCAGYNKDGVCISQIPVTNYHDATYRFNLQEGEEAGWVYVNEVDYNKYQVGDYFGGQNQDEPDSDF